MIIYAQEFMQINSILKLLIKKNILCIPRIQYIGLNVSKIFIKVINIKNMQVCTQSLLLEKYTSTYLCIYVL